MFIFTSYGPSWLKHYELDPFIPEFLKWPLPALCLDMSTDANRVFQSKIQNRMANSVDPDEMALNDPSHQDLHCLHRYHKKF